MTYLMVVRVPADASPTPEEADATAWVEATSDGQRLFGDRLRPPEDATCVRVRDGRTLVTHGPFVEIAEQIAGFDLLTVQDRDEAVRVALAHPVAKFGALELRELHPFELPDGSVDDEPFLGEPITYVLLMGSEPGAPTPGPEDEGFPATWIEKVGAAERGGARLRPADEAITVRVRDDKPLVTHGPFAELAEQVAGYDLLDVPDLDAAIALAAAHPAARLGVVEIRPRWPFGEE
jgi:hypothetical protein